MAAFFLIYIGLGLAVVGILTLALTRRLRLSFVNVVLFVPGALFGMVVISKLFFMAIVKTMGLPVANKMMGFAPPYMALGAFLVCGILGGTSVVALKTFLTNKLEHRGR